MTLRALVILAVVFAPALAHADLYTLSVGKIIVKDTNGHEANERVETDGGIYSCNLDPVRPAKGQQFTVWFAGRIVGTEFKTSDKGGAPAPVVSCVRDLVANAKFSSPPGTYRVIATVSFRPAQH